MAHRVISVRRGIWSLSGHSELWTSRPPQSPGVTAANFSAKFFAKFFGESWVAFHGTDFLGGAPLGPPPGLEVDLIRLTTPAVTHEWSVANVDALTRNGVNSTVAHPPA